MKSFQFCFLWATLLASVASFTPTTRSSTFGAAHSTALFQTHDNSNNNNNNNEEPVSSTSSRRNVVSALGLAGASGIVSALTGPNVALAEEDSFAEIAARANRISKDIEQSTPVSEVRKTDKTMYDFSLPVEGKQVPIKDILRQSFDGENARVKAVLVVNIKQDDPVARKDIPELISLVTKYVIFCVCVPRFCLYCFDYLLCFIEKKMHMLLDIIFDFISLSNLCLLSLFLALLKYQTF